MHQSLSGVGTVLGAMDFGAWLTTAWLVVKVLVGFSIIIFVHEMGHFLAAKWVGVRVDRFAVGFGTRLIGWRRGEGLTFGNRPNYSADEINAKGFGETDYCLKALPLGGYVKMLGQDDIIIDEQTNEMRLGTDPRAFNNHSVGHRMLVVSAGVVFNLLFAALLLVGVFMIGKKMIAPVIGSVEADKPAMQGGLVAGDRILEINGRRVDSFNELIAAQILADGPLHFRVQRGATVLVDDIVIEPVRSGDARERLIGIRPAQTTELIEDGNPVGNLPAPKAGDRITQVDGRPVETGADVERAFLRSGGEVLKLTVERKDPKHPSTPPQTLEVFQRATLFVGPSDTSITNYEQSVDSQHILGLLQRRAVGRVIPNTPADKSKFKAGDVVAEWGAISNPTFVEIKTSIRENVDKPIRVIVIRGGKREELTVTPEQSFSVSAPGQPSVGIVFAAGGEQGDPVVASIVPNTPMAALNIPRGARLLAVGDRAVNDWFEVVQALKASAGTSVAIRFRAGDDEASGVVQIPGSVVNELKLPPSAMILSIDGLKSVTLDGGTIARLPAVATIRRLLEQNTGKTVAVEYVDDMLDNNVKSQTFAIRPDNIDPWQMRIQYGYEGQFSPLTEVVSAHGNPLAAMMLGAKYTWNTVTEVFLVMKHMAKRNLSAENVSGPVGIISHAIDRAREGWVELMFFLAFLSANLAVINFLPLPVMDGGLMLFLIIEKIKGRPLSLKTQMVSTLVGLAVIVISFLFVTIQDVSRFF